MSAMEMPIEPLVALLVPTEYPPALNCQKPFSVLTLV